MLARSDPPDADAPPSHRLRRRRSWGRRALSALTVLVALVVLLVGLAASLTHFVDPPFAVPDRTATVGAVLVTTVLGGLAVHRVGGNTVAATMFSAAAGAVAVVTGLPWLMAGVVALSAFAATVLAVVSTRPAKTPLAVVREYVVAIGVALVGAVAVAAYSAPLRPSVLGTVVLLTSLTATLWLAHRLGGGFAGLGTRGALVILSAVTVLVAGLAYGAALSRWGSPAVIDTLGAWRDSVTNLLGAVPRPLEFLIGFPALVWGLATRAHLRQGWWICAFGCLGTSGVTTSLVGPDAELGQELLSTLYSVVIGLILGFLVWRVDRLLTGPRGRRGRRADRSAASRPEPSRARPLL